MTRSKWALLRVMVSWVCGLTMGGWSTPTSMVTRPSLGVPRRMYFMPMLVPRRASTRVDLRTSLKSRARSLMPSAMVGDFSWLVTVEV